MRKETIQVPVAQQTIGKSTVAQQNDREDEDNDAEQTWPSVQQERQEVEDNDQHLIRRHHSTDRLGDEQHRQHPVQTIHHALYRTPYAVWAGTVEIGVVDV